jgi:hypothetical protein
MVKRCDNYEKNCSLQTFLTKIGYKFLQRYYLKSEKIV